MGEQDIRKDEDLDETELDQVAGGGVVVHESDARTRTNEQNDKLRAAEQNTKVA